MAFPSPVGSLDEEALQGSGDKGGPWSETPS